MWDERYSSPEYAFGTQPNDFLVSVASKIPKGRVLCLGEGEGRNAVYLASLGYEVVAVDQSKIGLAKAQQLATQQQVKIHTIVADLADFVIEPQSWQGIVSIFCHLPFPLWGRVHRSAVAGLARGGLFILEAYTPRQLQSKTGGPKNLDMLVSPDLVRSELADLHFEVLQEVERNITEGIYHNGMSAVLQVLGKAH
jgi:SAM-dependent methyltransferase